VFFVVGIIARNSMSLAKYIRNEQKFQIYILEESGSWEPYSEEEHGKPSGIFKNYIVAYDNNEILDNTAHVRQLPSHLRYIEEKPYVRVAMPKCIELPFIEIKHTKSLFHQDEIHYCTEIINHSDDPLTILEFAAFAKTSYFGKYNLHTISNTWFTQSHFAHWYNCPNGVINPNSSVVDQDNFGGGKGFWIFNIKHQRKQAYIKTSFPRNVW
jgi:hypothetical protein